MKWIFTLLITLALIFASLNNRITQVSNAAISEGIAAIELVLTLAGGMCLWCGVMRVAKTAGLTEKLTKLLSPIISRLFKGSSAYAQELIAMNMTANFLGLGNAATPLGLSAMGELAKDSKDGIATGSMIMLVVINTASLQLIPTTVATMRLKYGAGTPLDILPCVLISSLAALTVGVGMVALFNKIDSRRQIGESSCGFLEQKGNQS